MALALLEVGNLTPSLLVADHAAKAAGVRIVAIESTDSPAQCIILEGEVDAVQAAGEAGVALAQRMGATSLLTILSGPTAEVVRLAHAKAGLQPPVGNLRRPHSS
jgi:microcompartment protein CcmL/EutN